MCHRHRYRGDISYASSVPNAGRLGPRPGAATQSIRRGHIDVECLWVCDDDAIVVSRAVNRHQSVFHVQHDFLDRTLERIAVATATRIEVGYRFTRLQVLDHILADRLHLAAALHFDTADLRIDHLRDGARGADGWNASAFAERDERHFTIERLDFPSRSGSATELARAA